MNVTLSAVPAWAALVPLGCYLVVLGWLHLRRRPAPVSGGIDLAALAAAVSGFVLAGPLALLQPAVGTAAWATLMMLGALVLIVAGGLLATRPRLVIYNVTVEQLRPLLAEVVGQLDGSARWAGESVVLPAQGLQVLMDGRGIARCVSLVAVGTRGSPEAWAEFARRVRRGARNLRVRRNLWGGMFLAAGLTCLAAASAWAIIDRGRGDGPPATASSLSRSRPFPSSESCHARACRSLGA
jgi:uncharacterized membrane protein